MLLHTGTRGLGAAINASKVTSLYDVNVAQLYAALERFHERIQTFAYSRDKWGTELDSLHASVVDLDSRLSGLDEAQVGDWLADAALVRSRVVAFDEKLEGESRTQMIVVIGGSGALIGLATAWIARMRRSKRPLLLGTAVGAGAGLVVFGLNRALAKK